MQNLKGFPYFEVEFNKDGIIHDPNQVKTLTDFLGQRGISDMFVISHGWNNDMDEARDLYRRFFECMRTVIDSGVVDDVSTRSFAVLAVLWPSKKFAEQDLIPSGAASGDSPIISEFLKHELEGMKGLFDDRNADAVIDKAIRLVAKLEDSPKAQAEFVDLLRSLLPKSTADDTDASGDFFKLPGNEIIKRLSRPVPVVQTQLVSESGGAAMVRSGTERTEGGAAGFGQFFSGIKSGALNLLNLITYYQMKERAGLVGSKGVNSLLKRIQAQQTNIKLHLIGHSFGARLVTAATVGPEDQMPVTVNTLTLLQAAFSHYGFAKHYDDAMNNGYFRKVVTSKAVKGPVVISFTKNDLAVGKAYPLASLVAGQVAAALGDENDKYGSLGRNGAQKTPEAIKGALLAEGASYQLEAGKLHNLNADEIIKDHSDICHNEVAYAILSALSKT